MPMAYLKNTEYKEIGLFSGSVLEAQKIRIDPLRGSYIPKFPDLGVCRFHQPSQP
jgi:hypothetical protein